MRTVIAVTTAPATAVCVGTLTDEHSPERFPEPADCEVRPSLYHSTFWAAFLRSLCSSLERAEGREAALLLLHHG